jgi:hypothetical protein
MPNDPSPFDGLLNLVLRVVVGLLQVLWLGMLLVLAALLYDFFVQKNQADTQQSILIFIFCTMLSFLLKILQNKIRKLR